MKKLTLSILSLIFLLCATVGLVGCKEQHTHSFTEQKVEQQYLASEATCTQSAKYYYSCSCGEKGTETFASGNALGHSLGEWKIVKESTQTTMGLKIRKCTRSGCDYSENENIPMLHTHSFTNYVSDNNATCTKDGTKTAKCNHCDATDTIADAGSKLPHTFDKQVATEKYLASPATCTQSAKYYYSCTCGEKGTETFASGKAKGHTEVIDNAKAATCTESGLTEGKHCSVCNTVLVKQNVVPAKGHTEVIDNAKATTCTESGLTEGKHCSVCDTVLVKQNVIPAKGHTEVIDNAKAATCTESGLTEGKHCSVCNTVLVKQNVVPAKGHTEVIDNAKAATCTESGLTEGKHCSVCNTVLIKQDVVPAKGHTYSEKWSQSETEHWHVATCEHSVEKDRAKHNFINNVCSVCKYDRTIFVTSISLDKSSITIDVDDAVTLSATILPTDATDKTIVWSSSDTNVATVDSGVVTAIKRGTATITAKCGSVSATCNITVNDPYEDFTFTLAGNGYTVSAYSGNQAKVTVPSTYKGKSVTIIGERAFYDCSQINEIVLPNTIKEIGASAFGYCTSLNKIEIPSCTRLKDNAFIGCTQIAEIVLPNGLVSIGATPFAECSALKKVTVNAGTVSAKVFSDNKFIEEIIIGKNITEIAQNAFSTCAALKYLTMPSVTETAQFRKYYFGAGDVKWTFSGSSGENLVPEETERYTYTYNGTTHYGMRPKDGTNWFYGSDGLTYNGKYYAYSGSPINVTEWETVYSDGISFKRPKKWSASFYYMQDTTLKKLTITDQLISVTNEVFKGLSCEIDVKQKFPVESVVLVGKAELYLDEFTLSDYTIKVRHTDGFSETFALSEEHLLSDVNDLKTAGEKTLSFSYGGVSGEFALTLKLHVFENVTMDDLITVSDGTEKSLIVKGAPDGTTITYENNGQTAAGEYTVTATLTKPYYKTKVLTATLCIRQETYKITYVLNNAEAINVNPAEYYYGKTLTLTAPVSTTASFAGWYNDEAFVNKFNGLTATDYGDITLYAKWNDYYTVEGDCITGLTETGKKLSAIDIPEKINGIYVTTIGNSAFENCTSLTSITIGSNITEIGDSAFSGCTNLASVTIGNGVTKIGNSVFNGCSGLNDIIIPDNVTTIGDSAFSGCTNLAKVIWNAKNCTSATSNKQPLFSECTNLIAVVIGENVKTIPWYIFSGCSGLTSVTIPDSVTSIGDEAFKGCSGLENIYITDIAAWCKKSGLDNLMSYGSESKKLYLNNELITDLVIPDSVTYTGYKAFYNCRGLTSVTIGNGVTSISNYTFYGCTGLTSITIGNGVTYIGDSAFSGCSGLTSVTIPDSVTSIGYQTFYGCSGLTSITIPDSVTSIGYSALYGCSGLTSITIPDSVTSIGYQTFYKCRGLTSVTIGNGVTSIGSYAFSGCSGLESITVSSGNTKYHSSGNCLIETESKKLILGCKNSIIPTDGSVTSIGDSAFESCSGLTSVTIPDSVTTIGYGAFGGCSGLTSVTIPDSVTSIGNSAFSGCSGLTSVTIPDSVTSIGSWAFSGCSGLTSVTIGNGVTYIGNSAFSGCSGLTSVTIPDSVTSIGSWAFNGCSGLTSITIPDSVTSIERFAFYGCSGLTSIEFKGTKVQWNAVVKESYWDNNTGKYTVYCTDGTISK